MARQPPWADGRWMSFLTIAGRLWRKPSCVGWPHTTSTRGLAMHLLRLLLTSSSWMLVPEVLDKRAPSLWQKDVTPSLDKRASTISLAGVKPLSKGNLMSSMEQFPCQKEIGSPARFVKNLLYSQVDCTSAVPVFLKFSCQKGTTTVGQVCQKPFFCTEAYCRAWLLPQWFLGVKKCWDGGEWDWTKRM